MEADTMSQQKRLGREAILAIQDIQTEEVYVPEWGTHVLVRGLTARQRDQFEDSLVRVRKGKRTVSMQDFRARLCALCIVDDGGKRLFGDSDVDALAGKSAAACSRIYDVAARLSGLTQEDADELLGNSESGQSEGSPSD